MQIGKCGWCKSDCWLVARGGGCKVLAKAARYSCAFSTCAVCKGRCAELQKGRSEGERGGGRDVMPEMKPLLFNFCFPFFPPLPHREWVGSFPNPLASSQARNSVYIDLELLVLLVADLATQRGATFSSLAQSHLTTFLITQVSSYGSEPLGSWCVLSYEHLKNPLT